MHYLIYYSFILYNGDTDPAIVYHAAYLQEILNTIIIDLGMKGGGEVIPCRSHFELKMRVTSKTNTRVINDCLLGFPLKPRTT